MIAIHFCQYENPNIIYGLSKRCMLRVRPLTAEKSTTAKIAPIRHIGFVTARAHYVFCVKAHLPKSFNCGILSFTGSNRQLYFRRYQYCLLANDASVSICWLMLKSYKVLSWKRDHVFTIEIRIVFGNLFLRNFVFLVYKVRLISKDCTGIYNNNSSNTNPLWAHVETTTQPSHCGRRPISSSDDWITMIIIRILLYLISFNYIHYYQ